MKVYKKNKKVNWMRIMMMLILKKLMKLKIKVSTINQRTLLRK
jgi:hypothetical protein